MQLVRVVKKFKTILSADQKRKIVFLVILMIIGGFLEMASVSLILPFMNIVMNPEEYMKNDAVESDAPVTETHSLNAPKAPKR